MKNFLFNSLFLLLFLPINSSSQDWLQAKIGGGPLRDYSCAIKTDNDGNVYVGGLFDYLAFFNSDTIYCNGYRDYFLAKYNSIGNLIWIKNGGGDGTMIESCDYVSDIYISDTNIYIVGTFNGTITFGNVSLVSDGIDNAFIVRMSTNGNFIWAKKIGGTEIDEAYSVITDDNGNIYVAGISTSPTINTQNLTLEMNNHMFFITKLDFEGNFKWLKTVSGTGWLEMTDMKHFDNLIYLTGGFHGNINWGQINLNTNKNFLPFIAELDTSGIAVWAYTMNCENYGYGSSLCISDDYLYCCGVSDGMMFASTDTVRNSGFIIQSDLSGNLNWLRPMGQDPESIINANNNEIFVTGTFSNTYYFSDCPMTCTSDHSSLFVAKINDDGECIGVTKVGDVDYVGKCTLGSDNILYLAGSCYETTFGNIAVGNFGLKDAFWAKLDYVSGFGENKPGDNVLFIYANPNTGVFNVEVPDEVMNERQVILKIFDNNNRLVKQQTLDLAEETLHLQVEDSAPGIYYLQLISKKKVYSGKMVVR
ncbi:MAG: T9SS type A sorting domain-containing protein [Bacteroidales bacterium]